MVSPQTLLLHIHHIPYCIPHTIDPPPHPPYTILYTSYRPAYGHTNLTYLSDSALCIYFLHSFVASFCRFAESKLYNLVFASSDSDSNSSLKPDKNYNRFNETQSALGLIIKDHCILNFMLQSNPDPTKKIIFRQIQLRNIAMFCLIPSSILADFF